MTFQTLCFNYEKEQGFVKKLPNKAYVRNGTQYLWRAVYYNSYDGKKYVIVNGEAYELKAEYIPTEHRDYYMGSI